MSTQSYLLNDAKFKQKQADQALRDAQRALDSTPRSENLGATRARDAAQRTADQAAALVRQRQAEYDRAR